MFALPTEIKETIDMNFDMIVLATKNLEIKESEFEAMFPEILNEVLRMQLDVYNKLTTRKDLYENASSVMCSVVYNVNNIRHSLMKLDKLR